MAPADASVVTGTDTNLADQGQQPRFEPKQPRRRDIGYTSLSFLSRYGTILVFVATLVVFLILAGWTFLGTTNILGILDSIAISAIISCGLTVAMIGGDFDLSIGFVASLAGMLVTGLVAQQHLPIPLAIVITLGCCGVVGLANGFLVTKLGVHSFIATLGVGTIVEGFCYLYNGGQPVTLGIPTGFLQLYLAKVAGVPLPVYFAVGVAVILWVVVNRTVFGVNAQSVGINPEAAFLSGIRSDRTRIGTLTLSSLCAGFGGILLAASLGSGQPDAGTPYMLTGFAAAFLGASALRHNEFHIVGTCLGVAVIGVALNGLAFISAPTFWTYTAQGGLLIVAVGLSTISRRQAGTASG